MTAALQEFIDRLDRSGLVPASEVRALLDRLPPERRPDDASSLADQLVHDSKLTRYQAQQLCAGDGNGLVLGNYVIQEEIGTGGMGRVFKALHRRMNRPVALKILSQRALGSPEAVARFHREAQAMARLNHPNIVLAHDADEAHGLHYLVMEYVDGSDLAQQVRQHGPLSVPQAVDCMRQAARGLAYAHSQGLLHRDVKPSNLFLTRQGQVKVLDLGLSRFDDGDGHAPAELTLTGCVMGTVDFVAPEQAENPRTADGRADIYSLGCSLWYVLTGQPLYQRETSMLRLLAHRHDAVPSLRDVRPDVPAALDELFQQMVAKRPEDRFQTMAEVAAALEGLAGSLGTVPVVPQDAEGRLPAPSCGRINGTRQGGHQAGPHTAGPQDETLIDRVATPQPLQAAGRRRLVPLSVLVVGLLVLVVLLKVYPVLRHGRVVRMVRQTGGFVWYEHEFNPAASEDQSPGLDPLAAAWLRPLLGDEYLYTVACVNLRKTAADDAQVAMLRHFPHLQALELSGTGVTDDGLAALRHLDDLEFLYLSDTQITDAGLAHLLKLSALTVLDLSGTRITDAGLAQLAEMPALKRLRVENTAATPEGIAALREALPELHVE